MIAYRRLPCSMRKPLGRCSAAVMAPHLPAPTSWTMASAPSRPCLGSSETGQRYGSRAGSGPWGGQSGAVRRPSASPGESDRLACIIPGIGQGAGRSRQIQADPGRSQGANISFSVLSGPAWAFPVLPTLGSHNPLSILAPVTAIIKAHMLAATSFPNKCTSTAPLRPEELLEHEVSSPRQVWA